MVCWLCDELSVCVTLVWMRETGGAAALSHGQVHLSVSNHDLLAKDNIFMSETDSFWSMMIMLILVSLDW